MRSVAAIGLILIAVGLAACGGSSSSSSPSPSSMTNVQTISVNPGPEQDYVDGAFTSVTICVPGTSNCQQINNILVDTGSTGLRILASAVNLPLPVQTDASGNPIGECALFIDSFTWGPVATADIGIAGEKANSVPLQIIGPSEFLPPPAGCINTGLPPTDTLSSLGTSGFLGIGVFAQDCGAACASLGPSNPGVYYSCPSTGCFVTAVSPDGQVQNPVVFFSSDNNGVVIELPKIGANGAATVSGSLIFGIGTESNNALGKAQVFTTDDLGNFTTTYADNSYSNSFIDSGSNGIFFLTSATTGIADCPSPDAGFYCPPSTLDLNAQNTGQNGASDNVAFSIANAEQLFNSGNSAFNNLGGPEANTFDWGLPFFFGRNVFVAIEGQDTPAGAGPYWAY
jgi:Protein of unknown function (DUF3443)